MRLLFIALLTSISLCACSGGGGSSSSGSDRVAIELADIASSLEIENAYSMVLGIPFVSNSTVHTTYDDLISNLNSPEAQAKLPTARILLSIVAPNNNGVFNIDATNPSISMNFLQQVASYNRNTAGNKIQILAYPDVEESSPWASWPVPAFAQSIKSCKLGLATTDPNAQSQRAMLLSICWASAMNLALKSNVIAGVVFDQQSNWIKTTNPDTYISWTSTQARNDNLLIGWISGNGIATSAGSIGLNFIEIYDIDVNDWPYYDTVAPQTVVNTSPQPFLPTTTPANGMLCTGLLCEYSQGYVYPNTDVSYKNFSPGPQFTYRASTVIGAVGANIYQCAISQNLSNDLCTSAYSDNVDITQAPSVQIMQAINYVKGGTSKAIPPTTNKYPLWGQANSLSGNVIYLFSTQYVGPLKSYFVTNPLQTSQNRCADPNASANSCSCIASKYSSNAFCGEENGFGTWGNYFSEFAKFTALFLGSQGGKNCHGQSCSAGIYMYGYIPQAWYTQ